MLGMCLWTVPVKLSRTLGQWSSPGCPMAWALKILRKYLMVLGVLLSASLQPVNASGAVSSLSPMRIASSESQKGLRGLKATASVRNMQFSGGMYLSRGTEKKLGISEPLQSQLWNLWQSYLHVLVHTHTHTPAFEQITMEECNPCPTFPTKFDSGMGISTFCIDFPRVSLFPEWVSQYSFM